jgi:uncharacterized LabA/DUF88 family protein
MSERNKDLKFAVLIDADNISYQYIGAILEEIAKYGAPTFKRLYGDMTNPYLTGWKGVLMKHAITPIQQFGYTVGKNSSDSALIIDAMDILYTGDVDGFCIVSSDSDFTRLANRLREAGKLVLGFGEQKTPEAFIAACNRFTFIEILEDEVEEEEIEEKHVKTDKKAPSKSQPSKNDHRKLDTRLIRLIKNSINDLTEDEDWVFLGALGNNILKKRPEFDPRNYGFKKLLDLIKSIKSIELQERPTHKENVTHFYVRNK